MTPEQDAMLHFVFSATLGMEIGFAILIVGFFISCLVDFVRWVRKRRRKRREAREFDLPRRELDREHPWHEKFD